MMVVLEVPGMMVVVVLLMPTMLATLAELVMLVMLAMLVACSAGIAGNAVMMVAMLVVLEMLAKMLMLGMLVMLGILAMLVSTSPVSAERAPFWCSSPLQLDPFVGSTFFVQGRLQLRAEPTRALSAVKGRLCDTVPGAGLSMLSSHVATFNRMECGEAATLWACVKCLFAYLYAGVSVSETLVNLWGHQKYVGVCNH